MASLTQSSCLCSFHSTKTIPSTKPPLLFSTNFRISPSKTLKITAPFAMGPSPPNPSDDALEEPKPDDPIKLAFQKAREYKKTSQLNEIQATTEDPVGESTEIVSGEDGGDGDGGGSKRVPEAVRIAMEKAREYQQNRGIVATSRSNGENEGFPGDGDGREEVVPEAVRIAKEKAREYQENKEIVNGRSNVESESLSVFISEDRDGGKEEVPEAVRLAMEKAKEYKKNKGKLGNEKSDEESEQSPGGGRDKTIDSSSSSVESLKSAGRLGNEDIERKISKREELKISSLDFIGLGFADKKEGRGLPAGLVPVADPFPEDDLPNVEILVGDPTKFENATSPETKRSSEEESSDLYKPKVSTWGMFPRPSNISKTFGGGKNIRPGQALETPEARAAKEARTKQLIAAYKSKVGLNIDPKLKAECEQALKDGDSLMDAGRLKEALLYYQNVMDKLAFQTELHGLAALQWSICQDSLTRPEKAQVMYEKLQSHPSARVSKKARQFMFSFQAMEIMKVTRSSSSSRNSGYQKYFEAFVDDKENYTSGDPEAEGNVHKQVLPYMIFLASPILIVLLIAASKGM